ncbi:hypothetical protein [Hymenobacter nivis]|uniref:Ig-like domain-containing protein n=1 Tax=Hymenobacter nivis TaxID=1850093 RepID=A0A502HE73_9BACT|nr:hypothetical protein [Hymenobacter nivis]TPG71975.1 hypothetical protein EAH73_01650 [Hymenobacter nivis]
MPGEHLAKLTIRVSFSRADEVRAAQSEEVRFRLAGTWFTYRRGGNGPLANEFVVPDPDDDDGREDYVKNAVTNLVGLIKNTVQQRNLPYLVSEVRALPLDFATQQGVAEFDISALEYVKSYDLSFFCRYTGTPSGWTVIANQATVPPVTAVAIIRDALAFGTATGSADVYITDGDAQPHTFVWADDLSLPANQGPATLYQRDKLKAGTYRCTITATSGASLVLPVVVKSDARFEVAVNTTATTAQLVPSGGLAPYAFLWEDDGSTGPGRTGLATGTYKCRVQDARGTTLDVVVVLSPFHFYFGRNPITLAVDAGDDYRADPTTKPDLSFLCEVWLEKEYGSNVFEQVGTTVEQPADRDGRSVFQVEALLVAFLDYHVPAPASTAVERAAPLFRRFFLKHAEFFGGVAVPAVTLERSYVLLGGLGFYENRARTWFTAYQAQVKPFLTWEPPVKAVLRDQPEFLYFMVTGGAPAFRCQVRVHFSDGTEQLVAHGGADDALDFEVYCLPVGYAALRLAELAGAGPAVLWWEVFVTSPDRATVLSETRRFELDARTFPKRRYFLFATSLGGMATYAATGEAQLDGETTGQEAALTLAPDYDPLAGDTAVQGRVLRPVVKAASGPRTRAQMLASQDLLLSKRVLLLSHDGQRWQPGYIKAKTSSLFDESKAVQTQEFEFYLPAERLYTPALGPAQVTYATIFQP